MWQNQEIERIAELEAKNEALLEALERIAGCPRNRADELSAYSMREIAKTAIAKVQSMEE